jgi:DNA-binding MarR family transcriptional regulator
MALIEITTAGLALVEAQRPVLHQRERELMGCLEPAEQAALVEMLVRVAARLQQLSHPPEPA